MNPEAISALLWSWVLASILAGLFIARLLRSVPVVERIPAQSESETIIVESDRYALKIYVGRAHGRVWVQIADRNNEIEVTLSPEKASELANAVSDQAVDAAIWEAQQKSADRS